MDIIVRVKYTAVIDTKIEIPGIESFDEVKSWFVKLNTFNYTLDGEQWLEINLNDKVIYGLDMTRPNSASVYDTESMNQLG